MNTFGWQSKFLIGIALMLTLDGAAADKLDDVRARGRLLVGVSETSPPFSWRDGENGIVGYDVDLAARVAGRLGVAVDKVSITNAQRIPALQQDRVDVAASGMTRADNRRRDIDFSLAYLISPHKVLVRRDSGIVAVKQLAGRRLALVRSASVDAELKEAVPTLELALFADYAACFKALAAKEVDGFLADEVLLASFAPEERRRGCLHLRARLRPAAHRRLRAEERRAAVEGVRG